MGHLFKKPKIVVPDTPSPPSPSDEAARVAAEIARRRRGRGGRKSTLLTRGVRLGGAQPFAALAAAAQSPRKTVTGAG